MAQHVPAHGIPAVAAATVDVGHFIRPLTNMKKQDIRFHPHGSFAGLVMEAGTRVSRLGLEALARAGLQHLSFGRIGVLSHLLDGPATQADLCAILGQKPPSMGELLARLSNERLVTSAPDDHDGRKTNYSLTLKGRRDILKARTVFRKSGRRIDRELARMAVSPRELERFKRILSRCIEEMEHEESGA